MRYIEILNFGLRKIVICAFKNKNYERARAENHGPASSRPGENTLPQASWRLINYRRAERAIKQLLQYLTAMNTPPTVKFLTASITAAALPQSTSRVGPCKMR